MIHYFLIMALHSISEAHCIWNIESCCSRLDVNHRSAPPLRGAVENKQGCKTTSKTRLKGQEVAFVVLAEGERDVFPGRSGFYPAKPSCGRAGGELQRLLGERQALGAQAGVHPAELEWLWRLAAGPPALPLNGVGQQRLPRLPVGKHSVLSCL